VLEVDGRRRNKNSWAIGLASLSRRGAKGNRFDDARQQTGGSCAESDGVKR